jgi:hypothetical protein
MSTHITVNKTIVLNMRTVSPEEMAKWKRQARQRRNIFLVRRGGFGIDAMLERRAAEAEQFAEEMKRMRNHFYDGSALNLAGIKP